MSSTWRKAIASIGAVVVATLVTPCYAVDTEEDPYTSADPDYAAGRKAIEANDWNAAIKHFSSAALRAPDNADIQSYLGYTHRKAGKLDLAFKYYRRALELNPRHRGAHEYIGEAYLVVGDLAGARRHLEALRGICLLPCEELGDLEREIAAYLKKRDG
ncbi:MAG TPA: tetratricopeptide repeat protein [Burkholderiales bacterium]|nr:tetratricopeptide repeat protein [Burkholderiales bacterium]